MKDLIVILDDIRSALNVGAIMRTCDGAGVKKLYLTGITPYPPHKKLLKTALGAEHYIDWEYRKDINDVIHELKDNGYVIYAIEQTENSKEFHKIDYPEKLAIIFGHEITGVSTRALQKSDEKIELPMKGEKNSLNVATTAGIMIYHILFSVEK